MRVGILVYRFSGFEIDSATGWLTFGRERLRLSPTQARVLLHLIINAPHIVSRKELAEAGWGGTASADSIEKAIQHVRKALKAHSALAFIETVASEGYRFVVPTDQVDREDVFDSQAVGEDDPHRLVLRGRRELKRLTTDGIANARRDFTHALERKPDYALAHVGLSEACALTFEATRLDAVCDFRALADAIHHARRAITIDSKLADAWTALGFAMCLSGDDKAGTAAAARAVSLAPEVTRHRILLGYASWGDDRIEAAQWVLSRSPGLALAYWLHATVLIARGALAAALTVIVAGCAAQDKQPIDSSVYSAVGLHLLHWLVLAALERLDEAIESLNRELRTPARGHIYSRQCLANTWYALGAVQRRRGDMRAANMAFERAFQIAPGHLTCMAALGRPIPDLDPKDPRCVDAGVARAVFQARAGRHPAARDAYQALLSSPHVANAGWMLPVEPILHATVRPDIWSDLLTIVQQRAT